MREWLRALPTFGDDLPRFDPDVAPADPTTLFTDWLTDAAEHGVAMPHAGVLATADAAGKVSGRTLILKDLDTRRWCFATDVTSPKARDLAANPRAALTFFWGARGRQVRVQGPVEQLPARAGAQDFRARPPGSRAAALVGNQSQILDSRQEYWEAYDGALAQVEADPDLVDPHWAVYALHPDWIEFWQATTDRGQIRLRYDAPTSPGGSWQRGLRWP